VLGVMVDDTEVAVVKGGESAGGSQSALTKKNTTVRGRSQRLFFRRPAPDEKLKKSSK
jgi:hypothetical protein